MSKNIILCSDGTGQKGGYGADSNVYKFYQMIDLHNTEQITFYDNGVGTSDSDTDSKTNAVWRAISGAFGFGFRDNVLDLYRFLARNYELGDQIYFVGFSRGAATVRACVGFIHHCGLLNIKHSNLNSDKEFEDCLQKAMESYQEWQDGKKANNFKKTWAINDPIYAPDGDLKIRFVGVWDTVSALGFPKDVPLFSKIFDKLDEHYSGFYDFDLNKNVQYAYQALSIDDARQTFKPMIWNESKGNVVEQVWFAGVHSNVGGGYPRTELSDVAFDWMLERAQHHGLTFDNARADVTDHANPHGKLYDSRDGVGMYYRYKPRNLTDLCVAANNASVKIHKTVIDRMKRQTAKYAPSYIPAKFDIVETDLDGDVGKTIESVTVPINNTEVNKWVKKRRQLYDVFMVTSLLSLLASFLFWIFPTSDLLPYIQEACKGCAIKASFPWQQLYDAATYVTPAMFENIFTYIIRIHPSIFMALILMTIGMWVTRGFLLKNLQLALEGIRGLILLSIK